jgi:hypothetical protein
MFIEAWRSSNNQSLLMALKVEGLARLSLSSCIREKLQPEKQLLPDSHKK